MRLRVLYVFVNVNLRIRLWWVYFWNNEICNVVYNIVIFMIVIIYLVNIKSEFNMVEIELDCVDKVNVVLFMMKFIIKEKSYFILLYFYVKY